MDDRHVIACNFTKPHHGSPTGGLCYLIQDKTGSNDRMRILSRTRYGRWVEKWADTKILTNFRIKTIPPEHPLYSRLKWHEPAEYLFQLLDNRKARGL